MRLSATLASLLLTFGLIACQGGGTDEEGTMDADTTALTDTETTTIDGTDAGGLSTPSWMTVDETARTVTMEIQAGESEENNRWNYNGLYAGEGTIVVPQGYSVTINFTNSDPTQPHSLGIGEWMETYPATFENPQPVFAGAITPDPVVGTPPQGSASVTFTADQAGEYAMICYVPGHAVAGMVIPFTVSADGQPGVQQTQS